MSNLFDLYRLIKENNVSAYTIYLDMDGVIADFDQRFMDVSGMTPNEYKDKHGLKKFWNLIDKENKVKFWVGILTAPSVRKQSKIGKTVWLRKIHPDLFPNTPKINFKPAKEKHQVKQSLTKSDILIDDKVSTIDTWNQSGGTGILHTSTPNTINQLKKLKL